MGPNLKAKIEEKRRKEEMEGCFSFFRTRGENVR